LTSSELSQCFKLGRVHYCQGRQILRTNFRKTCLGALYVKDAEAASWYCDFQVQPADERVFRVRNDDYLVYTNKEIVATKKCGPSVSQTVQITEGTAVNIPGGCNLQLEDHKIYGEDSIRTEVSETQILTGIGTPSEYFATSPLPNSSRPCKSWNRPLELSL
jgi:hypothetical protein